MPWLVVGLFYALPIRQLTEPNVESVLGVTGRWRFSAVQGFGAFLPVLVQVVPQQRIAAPGHESQPELREDCTAACVRAERVEVDEQRRLPLTPAAGGSAAGRKVVVVRS